MEHIKFGFTGDSSSLQVLSTKLGHWWYIFFAAAGSAVISISASFAGTYDSSKEWGGTSGVQDFVLFLSTNPWLWIVVGALTILYGGKGTYTDQKALNKINSDLKADNSKVQQLKEKINGVTEDSESLQNELAQLQVKLVATWLKGSSRQLNLGTHCRATIYYYVDEHFYLLARYSQNPKYSEVHRQKFSKNQGVISKAWEHKVCVDIEGIPSYEEKPDDYKEYMQKNYGYAAEKTDTLTMKSCQYVAVSITEADNHIGVIVFESDTLGLFKTQKVSQIKKYCAEYQSYMVDFIHGGIKYDKTVKVSTHKEHDVDEEFMAEFGGVSYEQT